MWLFVISTPVTGYGLVVYRVGQFTLQRHDTTCCRLVANFLATSATSLRLLRKLETWSRAGVTSSSRGSRCNNVYGDTADASRITHRSSRVRRRRRSRRAAPTWAVSRESSATSCRRSPLTRLCRCRRPHPRQSAASVAV